MTKEDVLKQCTIEGNVVKLPGIRLDRPIYIEVMKALELIGGSWKGGKTLGFVFKSDPTILLNKINQRELKSKKETQFFATPKVIADKLVKLADLKKTDKILEPSAGQGSIIESIKNAGFKNLYACEKDSINKSILQEKYDDLIFFNEDDFLLIDEKKNNFDKIIANPPFSKNQDIDHIKKMFSLLSNNGRLVSIASKHWLTSTNKKETAFREWLNEVKAEIIGLEKGGFSESGTNVETVIIIISK